MRIVIDLTNRCNLKCKHCGNYLTPCLDEDIDFIEILNKIPYKITNVELMGGEPLLYDKIFELIDYFDVNDIAYSIISNGQFEFEYTKKVFSKKLINFSISIDGLEKENDYIRGNSSFKKAITLLSNMVKIENKMFNVGINFVINKINSKNIYSILNELLKYDVDYINLNQILPLGKAKGNRELLIDDLEYIDIIETVCNFFKKDIIENKINFDTSNPYLIEYLNLKYKVELISNYDFCDAAKHSIYINNKGEIYPCRNFKYEIKKDDFTNYIKNASQNLFVLEEKIERDSFCDDCYYKEKCYLCPLSKSNRHKSCKFVYKKIISYYDEFKYRYFKLKNNIFIIKSTSQICFVNSSNETNCLIDIDYIDLFCDSNSKMTIKELSKKYSIDYYSLIDLLLNLEKKGVVDIYES